VARRPGRRRVVVNHVRGDRKMGVRLGLRPLPHVRRLLPPLLRMVRRPSDATQGTVALAEVRA
jgi:hypothetical protein